MTGMPQPNPSQESEAMQLNLEGRHVLITGGSKGIGLACAKTFLHEGCDVTLVARDEARLTAAAADLAQPDRVHVIAADLSQASERMRVHQAWPDVDILVNNAGAIPGGGLLEMEMQTWEEAWALKVMGFIHMTKLYLGDMKARKSGIVCNIIGQAGRTPRYEYLCGGVGNATLIAFTSAVGGRSVDWGVRVFGINPSPTRTDRIVNLNKVRAKALWGDESRWEEVETNRPLGRLIEPDEIAAMAAFLSSPACGYVSGTVIDVDGGIGFR
jgi:3-oxoacyl-[acyl-carrier protein] reductase